MKRLFVLSVLIIAMLWGCTQVNEDTPATEEKNASYKVEHYQQNITDDEYTLVETDSENKNGVTGEETSAQAKTYEGFTAKTVEQVKITADGSSVVKIYYDRNEITLTLNLDGGEGQTEITGKYGATVNVTVPIKTGYTFIGWNTALPTTFPAISTTYKATWAGGTGTVYKVEHYQQNITDDEYALVEDDNEYKTGTTDEETSEEAKTYEGFTAQEVEQVKIAADGSSVVKIYYDRNEITLTLNLDGGEGQTEITGKYGATVNVTVPIKTGYTFIGWNTALPTTFPAISTTYKATWTANNSGITITLPSINDAEINLQQVTSENTVTFTAADGFDSYAWYIDGVKQSETSATFAIDTSTIDPANYKIMVIVSDGNKYYSATADLEIRN